MILLKLFAFIFISINISFISPGFSQENITYDLEASEVLLKEGDLGYKYFSYVVKNVGKTEAPAESYKVFLKVNGKMISFDTKTTALEPGKSIVYTSSERFDGNNPGKKLKYKLIINTKDAYKENNKKKGEIIL